MPITEKDHELIQALSQNARMSISDLARQLKVSRTTVKHRLARLEETGVIAGYGLRLGEAYRGSSLQAYVNLKVQPRDGARLAADLKKIPQIEALFSVSGKFDMVLLVRTATPAQLDELLDRIGVLEGVLGTESAIVLSSKFDRR
ncbi:MAG: Lrp/AsnC family transcriptional regulator [Gammaproteobacteria bacterium]|nr:Lrp/AsnC family transcriptional regulator [Gammaproteobacteria bacterium]